MRKISSAELFHLKDFCLLTACRFYFTRLHDSFIAQDHHIIEIKDPNEYLQKILFFRTLSANKFANLV